MGIGDDRGSIPGAFNFFLFFLGSFLSTFFFFKLQLIKLQDFELESSICQFGSLSLSYTSVAELANQVFDYLTKWYLAKIYEPFTLSYISLQLSLKDQDRRPLDTLAWINREKYQAKPVTVIQLKLLYSWSYLTLVINVIRVSIPLWAENNPS